MKEITQTKKLLITVLVLNVLCFGAYGFLYWSIRAKDTEASTLVTEADQRIKRDNALRTIKSSLNENKDFISQIDLFFISRDGAVTFINMLDKLGTQSSVKLSIGSVEVVQDPKVAKDFKQILRLKLLTDGSWANTFSFLSVLENLPYRIEVEESSLTLSNGADSILYKSNVDLGSRARASGESWKGSFVITVLQLK